jgi:hypothetical protein
MVEDYPIGTPVIFLGRFRGVVIDVAPREKVVLVQTEPGEAVWACPFQVSPLSTEDVALASCSRTRK